MSLLSAAIRQLPLTQISIKWVSKHFLGNCAMIQIKYGLPYCVTCPSVSMDPGSLNPGTRRSRVPGCWYNLNSLSERNFFFRNVMNDCCISLKSVEKSYPANCKCHLLKFPRHNSTGVHSLNGFGYRLIQYGWVTSYSIMEICKHRFRLRHEACFKPLPKQSRPFWTDVN